MLSFFKKKFNLAILLLVLTYLFTHLLGLLELPVFADEAIYIRWSQLIIDDWSRYFFFSMNDGKTPLFFWLLAPFQLLFSDQLYAARFVSVVIGLFQMLVTMGIVSVLTKNKKTILLSGILIMILPFWYFHHRMALTDGLLTLMISCSMFFLIKAFVGKKIHILLAGVFFGLAILSKIPAILFIPSLYLLIFLNPKISRKKLLQSAAKVTTVVCIGLLMFLSLKIVPSFPQLFGRGNDFLFPLSEVFAGRWKETILGFPVYASYFIVYMTPTLVVLMLTGLFAKKNKALVHVFFWSGVLFVLPIGIMGKIVYARYLFPAAISFTLASVFAIEDAFVWYKKLIKNSALRLVSGVILVILLANAFANSGVFMMSSMVNHAEIPFVSSDIIQYLTEWSSGHGLYETAELIKKESRDKTIAVATEGYFGSLPDGLNLYFHRRNVSNIAIDGIGYPVKSISSQFAQTARNFDRKWIVANSHRMNIDLDEKYLIVEYCRPFNAPCLQVWDVTDVFEQLVF